MTKNTGSAVMNIPFKNAKHSPRIDVTFPKLIKYNFKTDHNDSITC